VAPRIARWLWLPGFLLLCAAVPTRAQTVGSIIGRVVDAESGAPLAGVSVQVSGVPRAMITADDGRFLLVGVGAGERMLRFEQLGYRPLELEHVLVRAGRATELKVELTAAPIALPGVTVEADRVRLVEPNVSTTRDIVVARELRELPIDRIEQAIELTPGVSGGHFRGGRTGQEVHVVDGLEVKNRLESSAYGLGIELAPSSLEEVEIVTGGFGAQYGSSLSGVVSYVTRRGNRERWQGRAAVSTDAWAPDELFYGYNSLSISGGGPLPFLGSGTTLFADLLAQGMLDAEPHARGLACLTEADVEPALGARIGELRTSAPALYCPYSSDMLPHQRGDRLIFFSRLDRPLSPGLDLTVSFLRNRLQRELYTAEYRYAQEQLGQRVVGNLGTIALDWNRQGSGKGYHLTARTALLRLDRHLGAVDPWTFDGRSRVGGFGLGEFRFLGEDYVHRPIAEQLAGGQTVPGYRTPAGTNGGPFGVAGAGLFYTEGTPHIANWSRVDMASLDLVGEILHANGSIFRSGASARLYGIESYERTLSHLAGSVPAYARFYPRTLSAFTETHIGVSDEINFDVGVRLDAFRSGIAFRADRSDFLAPVIDAKWRFSLNPRIGVAMPVPGTDNTAALRFNFGYVSQPPDFRYFIDSTVGDSLRTDIRRQGNPNMSFERGKSYELSISKLFAERIGVALTVFRKELNEIVTGNLYIGETGAQIYSTDDEGTVNGAELSARGRWRSVGLRASWAWQKATGLTSGLDSDTLNDLRNLAEYPLAFDRRHSIEGALTYGRAAGDITSGWAAALTGRIESGYPRDRYAAAGDTVLRGDAYLPWTSTLDLRVARELGRLPGCGCAWRVSLEARNLLDRENIYGYRGDSGMLGPTLASVEQVAADLPMPALPIPREAPGYSPVVDRNADGVIDAGEFSTARFAAALDRHDPSLFLGEPRQLRLGMEITF
jgi:hypothetical protein